MQTVGILAGGAGLAAPVEMAIRRTCSVARRECRVVRIARPDEVADCDRLVLAPTGTVASACAELAGPMGEALARHREAGKPVLGSSLGLLVMLGGCRTAPGALGLGWFEGEGREPCNQAHPLTGAPAKRPLLGWNRLMLEPGCHRVISAAGRSGTWVYFCCREVAAVSDPSIVAATSEFGYEALPVALQRDNVIATLFRPERSHRAGIRLIEAFLGHG